VQSYWDANLSSLKGSAEKRSLKVYPNPAKTKVFWNLPEGQIAKRITMMDMKGSRTEIDAEAGFIDVSGLRAGVYMIQLEDIEGTYFQAKITVLP